MTHPSVGSAPLGSVPPGATAVDPTAAFPTAPRSHVAGDGFMPPHPVQAPLVPTAPPAGAEPLASRDSRTDERRRRKAPLAWLPWALLAALIVLLALMLLAGTLVGGDRGAGARPGSTGAAAGSGAAAQTSGTLTAGGVDVLADQRSLGRLGSLQGQEAVGRRLPVQSVVADEGFWVGPSAAQRTFVFLTPEARRSSGESGFQVRQGQTVDLNGTVTGAGQGDPQRFGVTDTEGARQLTAQRAYVRARQVRLSQQ